MTYITSIDNLEHFLDTVEKCSVNYKIKFQYKTMNEENKEGVEILSRAINYLIIGALVGGLFYLRRKMKNSNAFNNMMDPTSSLLGKKKFEPIKPENIETKFEDVAGMHEAKSEIT